jgi:tetratricopeptide (TPR) repeat protein
MTRYRYRHARRRKAWEGYDKDSWTSRFFDFLFSNTGGWLGLLLGLIFGIYTVMSGNTLIFDDASTSMVFGIPLVTLTLGIVGAIIGTILSFITKKGEPITAWSRKIVRRGREQLEMGDIDNAIAFADKALRSGAADFPGGYQLRGDAFLEKDDFDKAVEEYTKVIKLMPDKPGGYCDRCGAYLIKGDYYRAIEDSTEAIRIGKPLFLGYIYRGMAYYLKGEIHKAIADYCDALKDYPGYLYGYYCRGGAYKETGKLDKAIEDFTEAIRRTSFDGFYYGCRGDVYTIKGDYDKAIKDLDEAIRFGPNRPKWHFFRGVAYEKMGDIDRAAADFNTTINKEPHSEEAASAREALKRLGIKITPDNNNPASAQTPSEQRKSKAREDLDKFLMNGMVYTRGS